MNKPGIYKKFSNRGYDFIENVSCSVSVDFSKLCDVEDIKAESAREDAIKRLDLEPAYILQLIIKKARKEQ